MASFCLNHKKKYDFYLLLKTKNKTLQCNIINHKNKDEFTKSDLIFVLEVKANVSHFGLLFFFSVFVIKDFLQSAFKDFLFAAIKNINRGFIPCTSAPCCFHQRTLCAFSVRLSATYGRISFSVFHCQLLHKHLFHEASLFQANIPATEALSDRRK